MSDWRSRDLLDFKPAMSALDDPVPSGPGYSTDLAYQYWRDATEWKAEAHRAKDMLVELARRVNAADEKIKSLMVELGQWKAATIRETDRNRTLTKQVSRLRKQLTESSKSKSPTKVRSRPVIIGYMD